MPVVAATTKAVMAAKSPRILKEPKKEPKNSRLLIDLTKIDGSRQPKYLEVTNAIQKVLTPTVGRTMVWPALNTTRPSTPLSPSLSPSVSTPKSPSPLFADIWNDAKNNI
jgi:hypothetical protein